MSDEKEVRPRRAPYKRQESAAEQTSLRATQRAQRRRGETDLCFQPSHRPQLPMSTQRELRPRRAPVKYYESDDDSPQRTRPGPTARRAAADKRYQRLEYLKRYRATHRAQRAESDRRYRERHRERIRESHKRFRERHRERIREKDRRYFEANKERIRARQRLYRKRHRERHREELREKRQRYRENHREELREQERQRRTRRRETHPELVREQNRIRRARFRAKKRMENLMTLTIPLTDCRRPVTDCRAKKRMENLMTLTIPLTDCRRPVTDCRAKKRMENLMTLTIPLTDCRISMPVTDYVQAFCDSLDSGDTPLPESFLQLLEEDGPTRLDSETIQGSEPSDLDDLSFLQDLLSPDEWEQVTDDVTDFDVEDFVADWLEDMPLSDEGVDLMYDLVT